MKRMPPLLFPVLLLSLAAHAADPPPGEWTAGLVGRATDGRREALFVSPTPHLTLAPGQAIHPQVAPRAEGVWTGALQVLRAGRYAFRNAGTAGELQIGGTPVLGATIELPAGEHPLRARLARTRDTAVRVQFEWRSEFFDWEPLPHQALGHRGTPPGVAEAERIARGRQLVEELNCAGCHAPGSLRLDSRQGPDLSAVGSRATAAWLYHWLENPRQIKPHAAMPSLRLEWQERADLAAFLASLNSGSTAREVAGTPARVEEGRTWYQQVGCAACHGEDGGNLGAVGSKYTASALTEFLLDPLKADPSGRMPRLGLKREEAEAIALHLVRRRDAALERPAPAGDPARGKKLLSTAGCLACHTVGGVAASKPRAPGLDRLKPDLGCLASTPPPRAPQYRLTSMEREALTAYLKSPDRSEAPVQDFHRLLGTFQCTACHEAYRPALAPLEQGPPPLTDAGSKLRQSWLEAVLLGEKRIRPWMALRMPHYGPDNMRRLAGYFHAQAGARPGEGDRLPPPASESLELGVRLIGRGEGGLSCINCHDYLGHKSGGEMRGPDMVEMNDRIRPDWLRRWLRDPGRIQPGTAMPAFFSDLPPAEADTQIDRLMAALSAGRQMPIPPGLMDQKEDYRLIVRDEPIVFRTFIQDSSPRSIAVGLTPDQSYCFDAEQCLLRYAWTGDFLDVRPVWTDRGGAEARILGTKYYVAGSPHPVRIGSPEAPGKVQFKGYRLIHKVPEFHYEVNGIAVKELIRMHPGGAGLMRSFEIGPVQEEVWFVHGPAAGVQLNTSAGALADGRVRIPVQNGFARFDVSVIPVK